MKDAIMPSINRMAQAVVKIGKATSAPGQHCLLHAQLLHHLLVTNGIAAEIVMGFAAWRYGLEDGAVLSHTPEATMLVDGDFTGHAWVETSSGVLIDASLWGMDSVAKQLDSLDHRDTTCLWALDYLITSPSAVANFERVRDGYSLGAFYQKDVQLQREIMATLEPLDAGLLKVVEIAFANPNAEVINLDHLGE